MIAERLTLVQGRDVFPPTAGARQWVLSALVERYPHTVTRAFVD